MNIYNNISEIAYSAERAVTVGTFDGVHIGHQTIINLLKKQALVDDLKSMLITFEPHPQVFLNKKGDNIFSLLTTINERLLIFQKFAIDEIFVIPFNAEFAALSAEDFICQYLYKNIGFKDFIIGFDHTFGKERRGDYELLINLKQHINAQIFRAEPIFMNNDIVSSTEIRKSLLSGNLNSANEMLGRSYFILGEVVHGNQNGKKIGFPTVNILADNEYKLILNNGVYACKIIVKSREFFGMANIGVRPTFFQNGEKTIEVNIFDFDEDLYGETIEVHFLKFIRNEQKFITIEALINQIKIDQKKCKEYLSSLFI